MQHAAFGVGAWSRELGVLGRAWDAGPDVAVAPDGAPEYDVEACQPHGPFDEGRCRVQRAVFGIGAWNLGVGGWGGGVKVRKMEKGGR